MSRRILRLDPQWRKAPAALLSRPPLLAAVFIASLLVALAAASSSLFTTAVGNAALKAKLAEITPFGAGLEIDNLDNPVAAPGPGATDRFALARKDAAVREAVRAIPFLRKPVFTLVASSPLLVDRHGVGTSATVLPIARAGFRRHVTKLAGAGGGVWIADGVARQLDVRAGGSVTTLPPQLGPGRPTTIRIGSVYRQLSTEPPRPYWANFSNQIYPDPSSDAPDPPTFVFMTQAQLRALLSRIGGSSLTAIWEYPVEPTELTLRDAKRLEERFAAIEHAVKRRSAPLAHDLGCHEMAGLPLPTCVARSSLPSAIALAEHNIEAVSAPTRLLADIGAAVALAVFAAAGAFVVARRRAEARLLFSQGESAATFAARTALEGLLPTVAGGLLGFALAFELVQAAEPDVTIDGAALQDAGTIATIAVAVGLVLFAAAAAFSFLRQYDVTSSAGARLLGRLPWELPLLAAGIYLLVDVLHGGGVDGRGSPGGPHPSLEVFLLPLLLLAACTGLALRVMRPLLARADSRARVPAVPIYLAVRRLVTGRGVLVLLTTLCVVSLGLLFYAQALAGSLERSSRAKAYVAVGSDAQGNVDAAATVPASFPFPATKVGVAYGAAAVESAIGPQVDMIVVDPQTFGSAVHWPSAWGPPPSRWLAQLARRGAHPLPVIATTSFPDVKAIWISGARVPIDIVARVRAFPAMSPAPLVVAASQPLADATRRAGLGPYPLQGLSILWARGPAPAVRRALLGSSLDVSFPVTVDEVLRSPDVTVATRTYSFLRSLGVAVGVLALVGVSLYLYARQRRQAIASAFSARMGAGPAAGVASLWLELSALLVFAALLAAVVAVPAARPVVEHTDPLPQYPPGPTFAAPWPLIALTLVVLVTFALIAAIVTTWLARRRELGEELRLV